MVKQGLLFGHVAVGTTTLLLLCHGLTINARGIDLRVCGDTYFNCNCGPNGYKLSIGIKSCTYFYRFRPYCKPCQDIKEEAFCSKYAQCLECNTELDRCVRCPDNRYGQWCVGVCQCQNGAICNRDDGNCQCLDGYTGRYCEIKNDPTCPAPDAIQNGVAKTTAHNIGDSVTYSCSEGFVLVGQATRTCTRDLTWSQHAPHCERICTPPPNLPANLKANTVPNGQSVNGNQLVKSMTFHCETGYEIVGPKTVTCLPDGIWDGALPRCVTRCPMITPPPNGEVTYTDLTLKEGTKAHILCKEGYVALGASEVTCSTNATWSRPLPRCEKLTYCSEPEMRSFVRIFASPGIGGDHSQGTRLTYSCMSGAILIGISVIECQEHGAWSNAPPKCTYVSDKDVTCSTAGEDIMLSSKAPLRINCPGGCNIENANIWGTGIYKKNSKVCAAAIHSGMITNSGGNVYIVNHGNTTIFSSSTSNSIKSKRSRSVSESFRFEYNDETDDVACPEGWAQVDDKCLLYIDKPSTYKAASLVCQNSASTMMTFGTEQPQPQTLLAQMGMEKASQILWAGDPTFWDTSNNETVQHSGHHSNTSSIIHLSISTELLKSPDSMLNISDSDLQDNCASVDANNEYKIESCDKQHHFICETMAKKFVMLDEDCTDPGKPTNGRAEASGTIEGMFVVNSTITFHCNTLHIIEGATAIRCTQNHTWSAEVPNCIRMTTCNEPLKIKNGAHTVLPELITRPESGGPTAGRSARKPNGRSAPYMSPRPLSIPAYGARPTFHAAQKVSIPSGHYHVGARVQFTCESQFYNLVGSSTRTCMADGQWSGRQPTCQPVCGISSAPRAPFIVNGQPTKIGQWPWQVALTRREIYLDASSNDSARWFLYCGGSLITESWVITAAHCVTFQGTETIFNLEDLSLYFGKYYRNHTLDDDRVQFRQVSEIHIYPDFNPVLFDGDLALIRLDEPVQLTSRVQPVCLPDKLSGISERHLQAGTVGVVTGWGTDETNEYSSTLLQADIPVVSSAECEEGYKEAGLPLSVSGNMFCAGFREDGKDDACSGDSGGPFVIADGSGVHERWYLEGVVSWGSPIGCGQARQYGGYSKVSSFLDWIKQFI